MALSSFGWRRRRPVWWLWLCVFIALIACAAPCRAYQQRQTASPSSGLSWRTARSLTVSLLQRIANHRTAKGDYAGAERIKHILSSFDRGFSFWKNLGSIGWDYLVHYSWRSWNPTQVFEVLRLINDIQLAVAEVLRLPSDMERLQWMSANYGRIFQLAKLSLQKLLTLLNQPGALRNLVLSLQAEIVTGDLLRDAMLLGAGDLEGLMQVAKGMIQRYYASSPNQSSSEL